MFVQNCGLQNLDIFDDDSYGSKEGIAEQQSAFKDDMKYRQAFQSKFGTE